MTIRRHAADRAIAGDLRGGVRGRIGVRPAAGLAAALLLAAGTIHPAAAQPIAPTGASTQPLATRQGAPIASQESAVAIARVAAMDLAMTQVVTQADYAIAAAVLELAHEQAPEDQEILRRLLEALTAAGDQGRVLELMPRLLSLDPKDTVAQLRLITGRILALQNADARLEAYTRFLGDRAGGLDPAVRSRLALDAALLLRERGDHVGFAERLAQAIELDVTNKDAASLALAFYSQRVDDPIGRLELLVTLFRADPVDPDTHLAIARELAAAGAHVDAARSYGICRALRDIHAIPNDPAFLAEIQLALWQHEGARPLVTASADALRKQRESLHARREAALKQGAIEAELPKVTDLQIALPAAEVILAAASSLGDAEASQWALGELLLAAKSALEPRPPAPGGEGGEPVPPSEAVQRDVFARILWMRLLSGLQTEEAGQQMQALRTAGDVNPQALARLEGWYLLRQGEIEAAEERLRPLADTDPLALLGLAAAAEANGDGEAAASWYADLSRSESGTVIGAYARTRAVGLRNGVEPSPPEHASRMSAMAQTGVPRWAESMVQDPRSFMSIAVEPDPVNVGPGDPIAVRLRLRNTSPIPLALGPVEPISSSLLLTPSVEFGMTRASGVQTMAVVSADRRLRLLPQEAIEVTVRPELGSLWFVLNQLGDRAVRLRWRALQDFRLTDEGVFVHGPLGLSAESIVQTRAPIELAAADAAALIEAIRTDAVGSPQGVQRLHAALAAMGWRWALPADRGGLSDEEMTSLAAALADRYARSGRAERLTIIAMTPPSTRLAPLAPVDAAAREDRDAAVQALMLVTRITAPDDPLITAASASGDPRLASLATLVADRLASGVSTLARPVQASSSNNAASPAGDAPR